MRVKIWFPLCRAAVSENVQEEAAVLSRVLDFRPKIEGLIPVQGSQSCRDGHPGGCCGSDKSRA